VLHPFPYRNADRLLTIYQARHGSDELRAVFHLDEIAAFRNESHTFEDIVAYAGWDAIYSRQGFSEPLHGCVLTPNAIAFWGVPPLLGRSRRHAQHHSQGPRRSGPKSRPRSPGRARRLSRRSRLSEATLPPDFLQHLRALGLGLSMIGLFGVMAYSVALQTHESGVRMALGARRSNILGLVLRQGLLLVGSGVAVGLAAAFIAARALQSQLWGVSAFDPGRLCARPSGPAAHRPAGVLLASLPYHPRGSHNCPALRLSHANGRLRIRCEKGPEETRG